MDRRAFLAAGSALFGGCTAVLPEQRPPADSPWPAPNLACTASWDGSDVTIAVEMGNRVTETDTEVVEFYNVADSPVHWVGGERPRQAFPLEPGDTVTVTVDDPDNPVEVIWRARGDAGSRVVCQLEHPVSSTTRGENP